MNRQGNVNYYLLLQLPFDPPVTEKEKIEKAIVTKEEYWSKNGNNDHLNWLNRNKEMIINILLTASPQRQQMQTEAGKIFQLVRGDLNEAARNHLLDDKKRHEIARRYQLELSQIHFIECQSGQKVDLLAKYYELPSGISEGQKGSLRALQKKLGKDNVYTYLDLPETAMEEEIIRRCDEKARKLKNSKNSAQTEEGKIYDSIINIAKYKYGVRSLEMYRAFEKRKSLLDDLINRANSLRVDAASVSETEQALSECMDNGAEAKDLILAFCAKNNLDVQCVNCHNCQILNYQSATACVSCGAPMAGLEEIFGLYQRAEDSLHSLQFEQAEGYWQQAEDIWPKNQRGQELLGRMQKQRSELEPLSNKMQEAMRERRYCEARKLYQQIQEKAPDFKNDAFATEMNHCYTEAMKMLDKAKALDKEPRTDENISRQAEACAEALRICRDLPDAAKWMPPPKAVKGLQIICDADKCCNFISWKSLPDEAACQYVLVRGDKPIIKVDDGEEIYCGAAISFEDKSIRTRKTYYYNVFAKRGEKYSTGTDSPLAKRGYKNAYALPFVGILGEVCRVSDSMVTNGATISLSIPKQLPGGMDGFLVVYDSEDYPQGRHRDKSRENYISMTAYENSGKLWIENIPADKVYISIFTVYNWKMNDNGETADLSKPQHMELSSRIRQKIRFDYSTEKKYWVVGKIEKIKFKFSHVDNVSFPLPKLTIVCKHGSSPNNINDGRVLGIISKQDERKIMWEKELEVNDLEKGMYISVFQEDGHSLRSTKGIYEL
ncbi:M48 family metallopeptidase [Selenomonas sp. AE3005]|uniref:tetratricopeptide repeat protein n=1 Tax=Selenomonas sp. AE3005 TaxID=1485543 RepID=UPI0004872C58|nr:hypothetical protein [Selenomonas sp. AE3005]